MELSFTIFFICCLTIQVYYVLKYFRPILGVHNEEMSGEDRPVSIVVAARNEDKNLPPLVEKLVRQSHSDYEIIIVNDRSEDNSISILTAFTEKHPIIKVIHVQELPANWNGKKHAIKKGIAAAKNDIILLTDADCLPLTDEWVTLMSQKFNDATQFVLGVSMYEERKGILNHFIRFETLWTAIQYLGLALGGQPYMGVGRNLAYKKEIFSKSNFEKIKGLTGGDDDLLVNEFANAQNTKVILDRRAQTLSIPKVSWQEYFTQKIRHLSVGTRYHKKDRTRLGLFALSSWFGWILFFYLLSIGYYPLWILTIFGFRSMLFYIIFTRIGQKLGVKLIPLMLPLLDLLYNIFYVVIGLRALTAKRIKWS